MLEITLQTGSVLQVPFPSPWTLTTDSPTVATVDLTRDGATITAVGPGQCWLTAGFAADLKVMVQITVIASPTPAAASEKKPGPGHPGK